MSFRAVHVVLFTVVSLRLFLYSFNNSTSSLLGTLPRLGGRSLDHRTYESPIAAADGGAENIVTIKEEQSLQQRKLAADPIENLDRISNDVIRTELDPLPPRARLERELRWTNIATLGTVLERIAVDRTVIICTINAGYWEFFLNFLVSLDRLGLADMLMVFAGDVASWHFVEERWPGHAVLFRFPGRHNIVPQKEGSHHFGGKGYGAMVRMRPSQILVCLEHGYSVLYSDVDSVFLRNPLPHFVGDFHVAFAWDGYNQISTINGSSELPPHSPYLRLDLSTALIFARPSEQSVELMQRWTIKLRQSKEEKIINQPSFNAVLDEIRSSNDTFFKFRVLPSRSFPSGFAMRDKARNELWRSKGGGGEHLAIVRLTSISGMPRKSKVSKNTKYGS